MNYNPYFASANAILEKLGRHHASSSAQFDMSAQALLVQLGLPMGGTDFNNLDRGTIALMAVCAFLKEHGGTIHALTEANRNLHQR